MDEDEILTAFDFHDLPREQQPLAGAFAALAVRLAVELPEGEGRRAALLRLLEARSTASIAKSS
jgi:hypothetical protein